MKYARYSNRSCLPVASRFAFFWPEVSTHGMSGRFPANSSASAGVLKPRMNNKPKRHVHHSPPDKPPTANNVSEFRHLIAEC